MSNESSGLPQAFDFVILIGSFAYSTPPERSMSFTACAHAYRSVKRKAVLAGVLFQHAFETSETPPKRQPIEAVPTVE
jgi:hypothetical protein